MRRICFTIAAVLLTAFTASAQDVGYARVRPTVGPAAVVAPSPTGGIVEAPIVRKEVETVAPMNPVAAAASGRAASSELAFGGGCGSPGCQGVITERGSRSFGSRACGCGSNAGEGLFSRLTSSLSTGLDRFRGHGRGNRDDNYGFNPIFRKLIWWHPCCNAAEKPRVLGRFGGVWGANPAGLAMLRGGAGCDQGGGYPAVPGVGYPGTPGGQMPGTLVFPQHPYVRSPRDFFMQDVR